MNSDVTLLGEQLQPVSLGGTPSTGAKPISTKRSKAPDRSSKSSQAQKGTTGGRMGAGDDDVTTPPHDNANASASKPKRVRTGCLTCRERHLKCDEGLPHCQNCRKSSRTCKRGVRLNFIDTKVEDPQIIPPTSEWSLSFQDESREIASEYKGGAGRYGILEQEAMDEGKDEEQHHISADIMNAPMMAHQQLPPIQHHSQENNAPYINTSPDMRETIRDAHHHHQHNHSNTDSYASLTLNAPSQASYASSEQTLQPQEDVRDYLSSPDETLYLQVFVEEVGLWMDSMDPHKHFSRILPFYALHEPMLLNAFLACGARHLTLVNQAFSEDNALNYYDTATRLLLKSLQNPNRDTVICATAAVILNVYEIMSERALQRMNHIAGARALIKECGWTSQSEGIGAACFWLNVGMELLSCLHFNWQVAWDPDTWGVKMDMMPDSRAGQEELWTYKMTYITAKAANFRASIPRFKDANPALQNQRLQDRCDQWDRIKAWCDTWEMNSPRTMKPIAILETYQTASKSAFPEVWLIKRTCIVARLFYHTAMCLLPQMHPTVSLDVPEMRAMQIHHAHMICGIVAHVKDRGVASVAIRCVALAAECLVDPVEQNEIISILEKIKKETGWRIDFLKPELKKKWGWSDDYLRQQQQQQQQQQLQQQQQMPTMMHTPPMEYQYQQSTSLPPAPPITMPQMPPKGIVNPLMQAADFNAPKHPYQNFYVAPNQAHNDAHYFYRLVD
ncbi:hypothetical protein MMC34_003832 [Xylographa carneopallida]|nr:hypothetical protein [Xylographa carneopallida]